MEFIWATLCKFWKVGSNKWDMTRVLSCIEPYSVVTFYGECLNFNSSVTWLHFVRSLSRVPLKNVADHSALCPDCHDLLLDHDIIYLWLINSIMSASVIFAVVKLLLMLIQRSGYAGEKEKGMDETEWNREGKTGRRERKVNEGTQQRIKMWIKKGRKRGQK